MSDELKITISGQAGTGKTTVALVIAEALYKHGIVASIKDRDSFSASYFANQAKRLNYLKENETSITIASVQTKRERSIEEIGDIMRGLPLAWRGNWCDSGACCCTGCVNGSGSRVKEEFNLTKEEHQRWYEWKMEQNPEYFEQKDSGEGTDFDIKLLSFGRKKIAVIIEVRRCLGLGLRDSKTFVESCPIIIKESISIEEAKGIKEFFELAGATVEII